MKSLFLIWAVFLAGLYIAEAQVSPSTINPPPTNIPASALPNKLNSNSSNNSFNFDQTIMLSTIDGQPFRGDVYDADGSPYYVNDFRLGIITLFDGRSYDSALMRLDLLHHEVQYKGRDNKVVILKDSLAKEILFPKAYDSLSENEKFRTGYPLIDNNKITTFYRVLSDGQLQLLKLMNRTYRQNKDPMSGEIKKEFETNEFYYIYSGGRFTRLRRDKNKILELMSDKKSQIDAWLSVNKIGFKAENDLVRLFDYYNFISP